MEEKQIKVDQEIWLQQQSLLYKRIDESLNRRQSINVIFISLLTLILTFKKSVLAIIITIVITWNWKSYLKYLKSINKATFDVIDFYETKLDIETNQMEYNNITSNNLKTGADYEKKIPIFFLVLEIILLLLQIFMK